MRECEWDCVSCTSTLSNSDQHVSVGLLGQTLGGADTGNAKITKGHRLPACVVPTSLPSIIITIACSSV